jgi:hypothetical protein
MLVRRPKKTTITSVRVVETLTCPVSNRTPLEYKWEMLKASWNVMAHAQKPDFVFRRNGQVHLNRQGRQFSRLVAAELCVSAVVMLGAPCSDVVWRVLATHSIRQFPLHFPYRASPCAITFQLESTTTAHATSRRPLTAGARVRSQAGQVDTATAFPPLLHTRTSFIYHLHNTTNLIHSVLKWNISLFFTVIVWANLCRLLFYSGMSNIIF